MGHSRCCSLFWAACARSIIIPALQDVRPRADSSMAKAAAAAAPRPQPVRVQRSPSPPPPPVRTGPPPPPKVVSFKASGSKQSLSQDEQVCHHWCYVRVDCACPCNRTCHVVPCEGAETTALGNEQDFSSSLISEDKLYDPLFQSGAGSGSSTTQDRAEVCYVCTRCVVSRHVKRTCKSLLCITVL